MKLSVDGDCGAFVNIRNYAEKKSDDEENVDGMDHHDGHVPVNACSG